MNKREKFCFMGLQVGRRVAGSRHRERVLPMFEFGNGGRFFFWCPAYIETLGYT
jgi:hypothetical protein